MIRTDEKYIERKARTKAFLNSVIEEDLLQKESRGTSAKVGYAVIAFSLAVLSVLTAVNFGISRRNTGTVASSSPVTWNEVVASYGKRTSVDLPDGSRIWLHDDSRVIYPSRFEDSRQIFAEGEIFAEIVKDPKHPMTISSNGVNVNVKGTTFNFRSYIDSRDVSLTLLSGEVEMDLVMGGEVRSFEVRPGTTLVADLSAQTVNTSVTDLSSYVPWKDSASFYFDNEPLENILREIERQFEGVKIVVEDKSILSTRYYASFREVKDPMQIFNALFATGFVNITQTENTYHISSRK